MKKRNAIATLYALPFAALPLAALPFAAMLPASALAQLVVSDTLTGATSTYPWKALGDACLTAGTPAKTILNPGGNSYIPSCKNTPVTQIGGVTATLPDPVGQGALRLTNGGGAVKRSGSVVSTVPFPTNEGVQVTFTTVTYGGNGVKNASGVLSGADGLAFFLADGTKPPSIGSYGGSLGYSCSQSNPPYLGVDGGYLAVAIDEFGNFSNKGDSTADGAGAHPGTIVVRGAGSITFPALNASNPALYPATLSPSNQDRAVANTCSSGFLQDWSSGSNGGATATPVRDYKMLVTPQPLAGQIFSQENAASPRRSSANFITYDLSITQDNLLSLSYSYAGGASIPVISKQSITTGNGALPPSFLFGFTAGTGTGTNVHEITCFKAAPFNTAANSAGANVQQSAQVRAGSQVYLSYFHPLNSWGQLTASDLVADAAGNVSIASTANWDGSCTLTGGTCAATNTSVAAQAPSARSILSWNGTAGVPFQYASLGAIESSALGGSTDGASRIDYLRGDRSGEITATGTGAFRKRDGVLGDIVNSSPTWVGNPVLPYASGSKDLLTNSTVPEFGASYAAFAGANRTRMHVVYSGANDGMLHGFRAGAFDAAGAFSTTTTPNDGSEVIAFMPQLVADSIHPPTTTLDFSSTQYAHNAYVDATPGTGDLFYDGAWHTWLVSGLGAGGNPAGVVNDSTSTATGALFALDITNPANFNESAAGAVVIKEWNSINLVCVNNPVCKASLGSVYGTPIIRLMHDGNWAVIFGNGRNSATGTAGIFIITVNRVSGAPTVRFLDTGVKSLSVKNGIDYVASADLDGDHVTDYLYAADSAGHVWRFDVTSTAASSWAADTAPMFTTPSAQPISTRVTVSSIVQKTGASRIVIGFGTGRQVPQTLSAAPSFAAGTQALYGIWDWNMTAWNASSTTQYASLTPPNVYTVASLQPQTVNSTAGGSGSISGYRTVSQYPVCWKGSTTCSTGNTQFGWTLTLPGVAEQIVYNPVLAYGAMIVNTSIPSVAQALSCSSQPASGFTMAISMETGGAPASSLFATAAKSVGITSASVIAGVGLSATGSPSIVTALSKPWLVQQTVSGKPETTQIDPPPNSTGKRITWVKLR